MGGQGSGRKPDPIKQLIGHSQPFPTGQGPALFIPNYSGVKAEALKTSSVDITGGGSGGDTFKTISVSGQSDVVADNATDTLTLVAGDNITITTNATTDTITIASTASGVTDGDKGDITVSGSGATWTIDNDTIGLDELSATGTPSSSTFLRGDNSWAALPTVREQLSADRTYYVRTDGSDSNDGLTNNSGGAFLTIQKAIDTIATIDLGGYEATVQVGAGTYTENVTLKTFVGGDNCYLIGDTTTPSNVVINPASLDAISGAGYLGVWNVRGFKLGGTGVRIGIFISAGAVCRFENVEFAACSSCHVQCNTQANITATGNYAIVGATGNHWRASQQGLINCVGRTITITGTPAFSGGFAVAEYVSHLQVLSNTFSGSATGARYSITSNATCYTNGAGATYFPGNSAGSTATGGQYL